MGEGAWGRLGVGGGTAAPGLVQGAGFHVPPDDTTHLCMKREA